MFQKGNQHGSHKNHWKGGRFTKEQHQLLSELATTGLAKWKEILSKTEAKWLPLQAQVTRDIVNKFVPDLLENENKVEIKVGIATAEYYRNIADRITVKGERNLISAGGEGDNQKVA